jgi:carbon monoxide dehydrogenase subunit G
MSAYNIEVSTSINNKPEAVMSYIADVRNRPLYLAPLKTVTDIKGDPAGVGTTWKWVWVSLGMEFQGTAKCLKSEPGKVYSFKTEGGLSSTWTYTAQPEGEGTKLTIRVDYDVPESARSRLPAASVTDSIKKAETERVVQNLKVILDK